MKVEMICKVMTVMTPGAPTWNRGRVLRTLAFLLGMQSELFLSRYASISVWNERETRGDASHVLSL